MRRTFSLIVAGLLVAGMVAIGIVHSGRYIAMEPGVAAADLKLSSLAGDTLSLHALRGRVILLNFWATWCPPCVWEMPAMERLHQELRDEGLSVVAINLDAASDLPGLPGPAGRQISVFVEDLGVTFTVLLDPEGGSRRLYGVNALPVSFLVDRDGVIRYRLVGPAEWDEPPYSDMVRELLRE